MTQSAALQTVSLAASGDVPDRVGYQVSFSVALVPAGNRQISLTLDPSYAAQSGVPLAAIRSGDSVARLTFSHVDQLDVPGPEPDETPIIAPAN
jgi:hypothetical protein